MFAWIIVASFPALVILAWFAWVFRIALIDFETHPDMRWGKEESWKL